MNEIRGSLKPELNGPKDGDTVIADISFAVRPGEDGQRLDIFLKSRMRGLSRSRVTSLIREELKGELKGQAVKPGRRVRTGETFTLRYPKKIKIEPDFPLSILYEDEHLLVVDKPPGQLVHPTRTSVRNTLIDRIREHFEDSPQVTPSLAHRLDRETSGCMIVAKNPEASRLMGALFARAMVRKTYRAIAFGSLEADSGLVDLPIRRAVGSAVAGCGAIRRLHPLDAA